jgi:hypothetical protein
LLQLDGIDEKVRGPVKAIDADVMIERTGVFEGELARDGVRVVPAAEQIDFNEMDLAGQEFLLLCQIFIAAGVARRLVGRAYNLDLGNQSIFRSTPPPDLDEWLFDWVVLHCLDRIIVVNWRPFNRDRLMKRSAGCRRNRNASSVGSHLLAGRR